MDHSDKLVEFPAPIERHCPDCGKPGVMTKIETEVLPYGSGEEKVELTLEVPVRECTACGFEYYDDGAEAARHNAVCRHLGLMTPEEVKSIRTRYGLSRPEFSQLTKIGEASIGRWERGALIQSTAYDQFLFLLTFPENFSRLKERSSTVEKKKKETRDGPSLLGQVSKFRSLDQLAYEKASARAERFSLVGTAASR